VTRTILLARHGTHAEVGHVLSGRSEIALNDRGHAEAAALAGMLEGREIASIHSSPRRRTLDTAAPIAVRLQLPIVTAPALDEIDFGAFAGRRFADLDGDPAWTVWNSARAHARCPGGETMGEAVGRAADYLFGQPPAAYPLLAVTHCDIIRGLVASIVDGDLGSLLSLGCDPGSLTTLRSDGDTVEVVALNVLPD
jgi:ribonuclease H / adenosylcobalamin/alpha-ribazole phosphatase